MLALTINAILWLINFQEVIKENYPLLLHSVGAQNLCSLMNQLAEWTYLREDSCGTCLKLRKKTESYF